MNIRLVFTGFALVLAGCAAGTSDTSDLATGTASGDPAQAAATLPAIAAPAAKRSAATFASLPDRGDLLGYLPAPAQKTGRSSWHRVAVSEAHALKAAVSGSLRMTAPDGQVLDFRHTRHVEYPDGNWSWVGELPDVPGSQAIITFGERAVFGTFRRPGARPLELTMRDGVAWMVERDPAAMRGVDASGDPDFLVAPSAVKGAASAQTSRVTGEASTSSTPVLELVLGYTSGYASFHGGQSQANTRLTHLVTVTNDAYTRSQLNAQVRLVRTVQVSYPDATDNSQALTDLTGSDGGAAAPIPAALQPLRQARDQYGGDLVSLVRRFNEPENEGCGIAWLIGGGGTSYTTSDAPWGYSVVSDGEDGQYYCREETLAHEIGHNLGQSHNQEDAGDPGVHAYSYGYRESSSTGFFTIMAYRMGDSQYAIPYFANPAITVQGRTTGVVNQADNVRSMAQTVPVAANFRATASTFADVPGTHWAHAYIERLYDAGITGGCSTSPRQFCPSSPAMRDEMAVFLLRAKRGSGYVPPAASGYYDDVPASYWAASWIERLRVEGISGGCSASPPLYCPRQAVTREQMAVFLLKAKYGSNYIPPKATGVFADVPVTHWAAAWIEKLAADGITGGCTTAPKRFCPASTVTRDQMAVFLVRNFGL